MLCWLKVTVSLLNPVTGTGNCSGHRANRLYRYLVGKPICNSAPTSSFLAFNLELPLSDWSTIGGPPTTSLKFRVYRGQCLIYCHIGLTNSNVGLPEIKRFIGILYFF